MNGRKVRETTEQIHISEDMQEEIIRNVTARMKNRTEAFCISRSKSASALPASVWFSGTADGRSAGSVRKKRD